MSKNIILKITSLEVQRPYAESKVSVVPASDDMFYLASVPEDGIVEDGDNGKVFNIKGLRSILKSLHVAMILEEEDKF